MTKELPQGKEEINNFEKANENGRKYFKVLEEFAKANIEFPQGKESWEDRKNLWHHRFRSNSYWERTTRDFEAILRDSLSQQKAQTIRELDKKYNKLCEEKLREQREFLLKKVEELKYEPPYPNFSNGYAKELSDDDKAHNSTFDQVIQFLQQDKE